MKRRYLNIFLFLILTNLKCLSQWNILNITETTKLFDIKKELNNKVDTVNHVNIDYLNDSIIACLNSSNLSNIKSILFTNIVLKKIPDFVFSCTNLKHLNMYNTDFVSLPQEISELKLLEEIYISSIHAIDISNLRLNKNLKKLVVPNIKFSVFPYFLSELEKVEHLEISIFNTKQSIEEWQSLLNKMKSLNSLSIIGLKSKLKYDDNGFNLKLSELNFNDCNYAGISSVLKINCFKNVKSLSITNSHLKRVPDEIINYRLISEIDLSGNRLRKIPNYLLSNCNIKKIDVQHNCVKKKNVIKICKMQEIIFFCVDCESLPTL